MKICCLCKKEYSGYGNNAKPLEKGRCCDKCNESVITARANIQSEEWNNKDIVEQENHRQEIIKITKGGD